MRSFPCLTLSPGLIALIVTIIVSPSAHAAKVRVARNPQNQCVIEPPAKPGVVIKGDSQLGLTHADLKALLSAGSTPEEKADNVQWVKWYLGTSHLERLDVKNPARIVKWADCTQVHRLESVLNDQVYSDPSLACDGGQFSYRFRVVGDRFQLDLDQKSSDGSLKLFSGDVEFTDTTSSTCPTRVVQTTSDGKNLKICLEVARKKQSKVTGSVGFRVADLTLEDRDRHISCEMNERFGRAAKNLIKTESAAKTSPGAPLPPKRPTAPVPPPRPSAPVVANSGRTVQ